MVGTYELWFRRTFNLPPTDPRFLDMTRGEIIAEYWAHHRDDLRRAGKADDTEFEDDDFDEDAIIAEINRNPSAWTPV